MTDPALVVDDLTVRYPDGREALRDVSLRVAPGERVAVLGPNGAGKTTLALSLNGVLERHAGAIVVGGLDLAPANLREIRRRVGLVFQDPGDQLFMATVRDDVAFGPSNLGLDRAEVDRRVAEALAAVGMAGYDDRAPHHLSIGERRRVAVATVLAMEPHLLVLDEPTANLDPAARRELLELLVALGRTTLVVTHDLPFAAELCERAVLLDGGRVVADGDVVDLLADTELLAAHRLELPRGYDVRAARR